VVLGEPCRAHCGACRRTQQRHQVLLQNAFKKYSMCELLAVNGNFDCRHTTLTGPLLQPRSLCIILRNAFAPPPRLQPLPVKAVALATTVKQCTDIFHMCMRARVRTHDARMCARVMN
jgi:hypothetical protein